MRVGKPCKMNSYIHLAIGHSSCLEIIIRAIPAFNGVWPCRRQMNTANRTRDPLLTHFSSDVICLLASLSRCVIAESIELRKCRVDDDRFCKSHKYHRGCDEIYKNGLNKLDWPILLLLLTWTIRFDDYQIWMDESNAHRTGRCVTSLSLMYDCDTAYSPFFSHIQWCQCSYWGLLSARSINES